jgi:hypothetical protein
MKNSKGTPSKDTGTKNNNSDNDVDYKNSSKDCESTSSNTANKTSIKDCK